MNKLRINLGKQLIESMGSRHEVDPLCRWMSHYISERIEAASSSSGEAKLAAQRECADAILKLWDHRTSMPRGSKPFEKFDAIFDTLDRINPNEPRLFFSRFLSDNQAVDGEVGAILKLIELTDRAARALLCELLETAVEEATDEETRTYLREVKETDGSTDVRAVARLIDLNKGAADEQSAARIGFLDERLDVLDRFMIASKGIRQLIARRRDELVSGAKKGPRGG